MMGVEILISLIHLIILSNKVFKSQWQYCIIQIYSTIYELWTMFILYYYKETGFNNFILRSFK